MDDGMTVDLAGYLTMERAAAIRWARDLLARSNWVILDTETTGLDYDAEVCQIGILSSWDTALLDTFVRPVGKIPPDATRVHGITDEMVKSAPTFRDVAPRIREILQSHDLVVYNLVYDSRILAQSADAHGLAWYRPWTAFPRSAHCAMEEYARFYGEWNDYHGSFKWQRLPPIPGETAHSAIADCRATLALLKRMAAAKLEE